MRSISIATSLVLLCHLAIGADAGTALDAGVGAAAGDDVGAVPLPKSWSSFVILVWQIGTDVTRDHDLYESVGLRGFHIDRRNDAEQAFARTSGWPFYVDHAADKGYLHLRDAAKISRKRDVVVRPHSLADPGTVATMENFLRENVGSAKGSSVVAYAFDDETSLGNFCSPVESDASPRSVFGYQKELADEYGTIEKLDEQYGTSFKLFAEVKPESFEAFRGQLTKAGIPSLNLSRWCDWRAAMDTQFAGCLAHLTRYANALDPATPAGVTGGQMPSPFGGYDYRKLATSLQWIEAYDIGGTDEILRSFWGQERPRVETFFSSRDAKLDSWFMWYYLCQGARGFIAWPMCDKTPWFAGGKVADFITADAATFKEIQGPVSQTIIDAEFDHDPIAIYYSQPSIQVSWALDASVHGKTWPNRMSSMDNRLSTSGLSRVAWLKTLQDVGVQPAFIQQDQLLGGELQKRGYKVLLLNRVLCLSDAEADAIRAFAKSGGTVVADHLCGICDGHGKARRTGALDDLFGVSRALDRGWLAGGDLTEVNGELDDGGLSAKNWAIRAPLCKGMAVFERGLAAIAPATSEDAGGTPVLVRHGKAAYLNLSPIGYLLKRSDDGGAEWTRAIAALLAQAGVAPRVVLSSGGQPAKRVEALFWRRGQRTTVCVVENLDRSAAVDGFGATRGGLGDAVIPLKLEFARPVKDLRDERTGKTLGDGAAFEVRFTPWEAGVYSFAN